jgi:hypothetical protein
LASVDEDAVECVKISNGARNDVYLKDKDALIRIGMMRTQPILKCGKMYAVIDGAGTAYIYEEQ